MNSFDLLVVLIKNEEVQARPINWDRTPVDSLGNDNTGIPVLPTEYMTTCPYCAQLIKFGPNELYRSSRSEYSLKCKTCGVGAEPVNIQVTNPDCCKVDQDCCRSSFVDPIAAGLIKTDNFVDVSNIVCFKNQARSMDV